MLTDDDLFAQVQRLSSINQRLPTLLLLAHVSQPAQTRSVIDKGIEIGFRKISQWNVTDILKGAGTAGQVAQRQEGWRLLKQGVELLVSHGVQFEPQLISETRHKLRTHLEAVTDPDRRRFLEEAITCLDAKACRAAVILSWVGAAHILQEYVVGSHVVAFNNAGRARFPKYKDMRTIRDFGRLTEAEFLQLCEDAGVLSKAEKQELEHRLGLRNRAGHPNGLTFGEHVTAAHIESLMANVYAKY